jgi:hypothetical protein
MVYAQPVGHGERDRHYRGEQLGSTAALFGWREGRRNGVDSGAAKMNKRILLDSA